MAEWMPSRVVVITVINMACLWIAAAYSTLVWELVTGLGVLLIDYAAVAAALFGFVLWVWRAVKIDEAHAYPSLARSVYVMRNRVINQAGAVGLVALGIAAAWRHDTVRPSAVEPMSLDAAASWKPATQYTPEQVTASARAAFPHWGTSPPVLTVHNEQVLWCLTVESVTSSTKSAEKMSTSVRDAAVKALAEHEDTHHRFLLLRGIEKPDGIIAWSEHTITETSLDRAAPFMAGSSRIRRQVALSRLGPVTLLDSATAMRTAGQRTWGKLAIQGAIVSRLDTKTPQIQWMSIDSVLSRWTGARLIPRGAAYLARHGVMNPTLLKDIMYDVSPFSALAPVYHNGRLRLRFIVERGALVNHIIDIDATSGLVYQYSSKDTGLYSAAALRLLVYSDMLELCFSGTEDTVEAHRRQLDRCHDLMRSGPESESLQKIGDETRWVFRSNDPSIAVSASMTGGALAPYPPAAQRAVR